MERGPSQVAPASFKQLLILFQWMDPWTGGWELDSSPQSATSLSHQENLHHPISRLQLPHEWEVVKIIYKVASNSQILILRRKLL